MLTASVPAEVRLPAIFGDHMVLQQEKPIPVWGSADPGESVTVRFAGRQAAAIADGNGKWKTQLAALPASSQGAEFAVSGKNQIAFQDVLVGEVWVCSGQSNMVATRRNLVSKEVAEQKQMRFFISPLEARLEPQETVGGQWVVCAPNPKFEVSYSAVGYFFAKEIQENRKVPVGMIQSAWGGTSIQPWIPLEAYEQSGRHRLQAEQVKAQRAKLPELRAKYEKETLPAWEEKHRAWEAAHGETAASAEAIPDPGTEPEEKAKPEAEPKKPSPPGSDASLPTAIFNGMVAPHIPFAVRGVIWYQGESNTQTDERSKEYEALMRLLVSGWRARWGQGDFPFLWVQLPGFGTDRAWARLRNSQLKALDVPHTGMAVALDLNPTNNLHPPDKSEVGRRLALLARKLAYGEDLVASGPLFRSMNIEGNKIRLSFSETGGGLVLGGPPPAYHPKEEDAGAGQKLLGFEVAGSDGVFAPADAEIEGNTVVVWSDTVARPVHAAYAWAARPRANLYNKEGLPASPFRTDDAPDLGGKAGVP
jgi:sialate O-acetylesterase